MGFSLKIIDLVPGRGSEVRPDLKLVSRQGTAGEIIAQRIREALETPRPSLASGLPEWLNLSKRDTGNAAPPNMTSADIATEIERARRVFESGGFIMLFDDAQMESWDQPVTITDDSKATFIRLIPLKGG